jgi:nucleotide-binding universal stress UspA family protein
MGRNIAPADIGTILMAVSTETCLESVVPVTAAMARRFDAEVVVFHVREWPFSGSDWVLGGAGLVENKREAAQILGGAVSEMNGAGVRARGIVAGGRPADIAVEIVETANAERADLIVIGAHRHSTLYEFFVGGIPRRVRRRSEVPVVIVPRRTPTSAWWGRIRPSTRETIPHEIRGGRGGIDQPASA